MTTGTIAAQASQSRVFVAEGAPGPKNPPVFQGCYVLGSTSKSFGDTEFIYCPDPKAYGKFIVVGEITGREEGVETSLSGHYPLKTISNIVKWARAGSPLVIHCHFGTTSNPQAFNTFEKAIIFDDRARISSIDIDEMGALEESARIGEAATISASGFYEVVPLNYISSAGNLIDDTAYGVAIELNYDETLPIDQRFVYYVVAADESTGSAQELIYTLDGGSNWGSVALETAIGATFGVSGVAVVNGVPVIVSSGSNGHWYVDLLGGSTTVVGVAGAGTSWKCISSNGSEAYVGAAGGVFAVIDDYASAPTAMSIGTSEDIVSVHAKDNIVLAGDADGNVLYSTDGVNFGKTQVSAGNNITAVCAVSDTVFWCGDDTGDLYYSVDGGLTWAVRGFSGSGSGSITGISFPTLSVGWVSHDPGSGSQAALHKTTGAGAAGTWVKVPIAGSLPAADFLYIDTVPDEPNKLIAAGAVDASGTDGVIIVGLPA